jgi:hypothetical protein
MARIWMSGFEAGSMSVFSTVGGTVNTTWCVSSAQARTGNYALYFGSTGGAATINIPSSPTELYMRMGIRPTGGEGGGGAMATYQPFMRVMGASEAHLTFGRHRNSGQLMVYGGTTGPVLAASTTVMDLNAWLCLEIHMVIHATLGVLQVRFDGQMDIDLVGTEESPINTMGGTGAISFLSFSSITTSFIPCRMYGYLDDIAINDTTGDINNSWPGRGGIYPMIPSGAGALTQFTPDSGDNYARVSDVPPDDDTSYVESAVLDTSDLYATAGVTPTNGTVSAVQWLARARLTDSGAGNLRRLVRHDGVNYAGDDQGLDTSYQYLSEIMEKAPDETEWTLSKVNALEIGQQVG